MTNVLFVCTANCDRSPTAEIVFRDVPGWNVKSAGTEDYANTTLSDELVEWADCIVVMEECHKKKILERWPDLKPKISSLGIEDDYKRCDPMLIGLLIKRMSLIFDLKEWISQKFCLH